MTNRLGAYELHEGIGSGGMATVHRATHVSSGLEVAVKIMTSDLAREPRYRRAFLREIRSAARLNHPGIVRVLDVGEVSPGVADKAGLMVGAPYLVMELAEGGALDERVDRLDWLRIQRIVLELLDALAHAHALGVVHRDLKPSNVLLEDAADGWVTKLTDFGIARTFDLRHPSDPSDKERRVSGTPKYMAPERVMGRWRDQGPWTDLYSVGVMVWKLVTGNSPFGGTTQEVLYGHIRDPLPAFNPVMDVPERLELWLDGMLSKSRFRRFRRAADAATAFRDACRSPILQTALNRGLAEPSEDGSTFKSRTPPTSMTLPTLTSVLERVPDESLSRQRGLLADWPRPPVPGDWRRSRGSTMQYRRMLDAGVGLFGVRTIPMIGREDARDELWDVLADVVRERRVQVAHVSGPAGFGKTRLAEWFVRRAEEVGAAQGLRVVHTEAGSSADGLSGMLARYFRAEGLEGAAAEERVREVMGEISYGLGSVAAQDATALAQMLPTDDDPRGGSGFLPPRERWLALRRFLQQLATDRASILWLEDAHLGLDAVRFARFLLEDPTADFPLMLLVTSRTEGPFLTRSLREDLEFIDASPDARRISIGRLPDEQTSILVRRTVGLSPELTDEVVRRSDGIPMFALQLIGDWVDRGYLRRGPQGYVLDESREVDEVPDDVHAVWLHRLERVTGYFGPKLSGPIFEALLIAAVLGRWVQLEEWHDACGRLHEVLTVEQLDEALERLVAKGLADRQRDGWSFAHGMMRESLLRVAKQRGIWEALHGLCVRSLRDLYDVERPAIALRVATHLDEAANREGALTVLLTSVRAAKASHDYDWIERLLAAAEVVARHLSLGEDDERLALMDVTRARILTIRHRLGEAGDLCEQTIERAARHGWLRLEGEATFQLGSVALSLGHTDRAVELFHRAEQLSAKVGEHHNLARSSEGVGYAYLHQGRFEDAKPFIERAGELYEAIDDPRGKAFNFYHRGIVARYEEDLEAARNYYEQAAAIARAHGYRDNLANALNSLGDLDRYDGDLDAARKHYQDALDLWTAIGASGSNIATLNLGITQIQRERWDDAHSIIAPLVNKLESEQAGMQLTFALAGLLPIHAARGDAATFDETCAEFAKIRAKYALHDPDLDYLCDVTVELWRERGDEERADATLDAFSGVSGV